MERSLKPAHTDWDSYYARPYKTASLTRKHTASVLVDLMRRNNGAQASILEFGGANSCFIDQILEQVQPVRYDVIDNNRIGLDLLKSRYPADDRVSVSHGDALATLEPERLYDIVFSVGLIEHFDPAGTARVVATLKFPASPPPLAELPEREMSLRDLSHLPERVLAGDQDLPA